MYVINSCTRSLSLSLAFNSVARLPPPPTSVSIGDPFGMVSDFGMEGSTGS